MELPCRQEQWPLTPVAALKLDLAVDSLPAWVLQLWCKGDRGALISWQALVTPEQPDEAATLLDLQGSRTPQTRPVSLEVC